MQSSWTTNSNTGSAIAPFTSLTQSPFILYFNARSLFNKIDELRALTHNNPPKIIAVTETWCQPHEQDGLYSIPGYSLYRSDRPNKPGGGTLLYISSSLTHNILLNTSDDTLESTWCNVTTNQESITIGCVYRPPNSPHNIALQTLEQCIRRTKLNTNHTIIVGDLNAKNNAWLATDKTDAAGDELRDLFRLYGLEQLVDFPTYLYRGTPFSCIDIVATDIDCSTISVTSAAPIGGSDHLSISVHITSPPQPHPRGLSVQRDTHWTWHPNNILSLRQGLVNADLVGHLPTDAPDSNQVTELWTHWRNTVIQIAKVHCCPPHTKPSTKRNPGPSRPWITQELLSAIKDKHKRYRTYLKDKSNSNWQQFTTIRNKVTTLLRNAKSVFVQSATTDAIRNARLHRIMKCLKQKTATPIPDLHHPPHEATTAQDKANMLNRFFIQQSEHSVADSPPTTPPIRTTPDITSTLHTITTSPAEVESLLKQLNTKKSPGHDGIPTRLLKEAAAELAPSLAVLYNLSFQTGDIPQDWKDATVSPIHKKGAKTSPTNYRPISLLSITSKIQEKIVYSRLYKHILPYLPPHQSGFRKHDGTELQLARLVHQISAARDSGQSVLACFFDLSKAFDRVWHKGLLAKLLHYGVRDRALTWVEAYLTGRRQRVKVLDTTSSWLPIPAGVPQGSVLGPLLFLIYTIDLPHACTNTNTTCSQFADDTALITSTPSLQTTQLQLQKAVSSAGRWLKDWHLLVNAEKTVTVIFHHDNRPPEQQPTIYLDGKLLSVARKQRHLGITFQHDLRWTEHTNAILNKSLTSLKNILRLRNSLNSSALAYLYSTYIRPKLEYACIALSPLPTHTMDKLERFQRKAARVCLRLPLYTPADHSHLLRRLSLSSLHCRRNIKHLLLAHSIHHRYAPPHILQLNLPPPTTPNYSLRHRRSYHIPSSRTDRHKDSPIYKSLYLFNSLPENIKNTRNRAQFKFQINDLLINSVCPCSSHPISYS